VVRRGTLYAPNVTGHIQTVKRRVDGEQVTAYAVDASPALAVVHAVVELAPRSPALVVCGINSGENLAIDVTISGTVGAALEGSAFAMPALAVSLEMDSAYHFTTDNRANYSAAMVFTQQFARQLLTCVFPYDLDVLSVNVPSDATPHTPWRLTRLSQHRFFIPLPPDRANGQGRPGYRLVEDITQTEPDSDIWALKVERIVSVTPLSLDLTSRVNFGTIYRQLRAGQAARLPEYSSLVFDSLVADSRFRAEGALPAGCAKKV